ncbi:MAG: choice-of-anchor E domain-containing protein [Isosphaeraceae bacterium]
MSAIGWIKAARRLTALARFGRRGRRSTRRHATPGLESLESMTLMSAGIPKITPIAGPLGAASISMTSNTIRTTATQTSALQTATVPDTLTNFTAPFNPVIQLFDPTLGTLKAVHVTVQASLTSQIKSQNTSTTSAASITPFINGNYTVTGLSQPVSNALTINPPPSAVTVSVNSGSDPLFGGASTVLFTPPPYPPSVPVSQTFPSVQASDSQSFTLTSAADLAFYTASVGRTAIQPTLTENAQSGATAPNGNLQTDVRTSGSGVITISYDYEPGCPQVTRLVRFGIHHQPTRLQVTFDGPLDETQANNPSYYRIIVPNSSGSFTGPGVTYIAVTSAVYNPRTFTVTLTTARPLNVHKLYQLEISLPCTNGDNIIIQFGGKKSLGGYTNPHANNRFVSVVNGRIVRR